jgi:thioesterase domain-containing protein
MTWQIAERLGYHQVDLQESKVHTNGFLKMEQQQPIVPIQPNGSKPPLFMAHAGGGIVFPYYNLVPHMPDQPIYGLQDPSVYKDELEYEKMEEMADDYVNWMQKIQPKGPYRIAGWSFGGMLAFEIAHNIIRRGEEVALVVAIDTWLEAPNFYTARNKFKGKNWLEKIYGSLRLLFIRTFKMISGLLSTAKEVMPHIRNGLYAILSQRMSTKEKRQKLTRVFDRMAGIAMATEFLAGSSLAEIARQERQLLNLNIPSSMGRVLQLVRVHQKYAGVYKPQPFPGKIHVIYADWKRQDIESTGEPMTLGWEKFADGGAEIVWSTGSHASLFTEPDVQELARNITKLIEES